MPAKEVSIHGGVVRVTDASILGHSQYNRVKAENSQNSISVHFLTGGLDSPGPREALLVHIVSGIYPRWLKEPTDGEEPVDIHFRAISTETCSDKPYDVGEAQPAIKSIFARSDEEAGLSDVLHMATIERGTMTRLQLEMTSEDNRVLHASVVMSKGQVTQMIATLLVLYSRLHEEKATT